MEIGRAFRDPADETRDLGMRPQRVRGGEFGGEFAFAEHGVDLTVADRMDVDGLAAALGLRDEVMLLAPRAERAEADRAGWGVRVGHRAILTEPTNGAEKERARAWREPSLSPFTVFSGRGRPLSGGFGSDAARRLARSHLANDFAGVAMTPCGRYLAAAESLRYDFDLLGSRFGVR